MKNVILAISIIFVSLVTEAKEKKMSTQNPKVLIETSEGEITAELYKDKAPTTVENFLKYVDEKFYEKTIFHRVIEDFMIQGGGFTADMKQKPTNKPIKNEANNGLSNQRGTLAMARTNDPNSATAQFFINVKDNKFLDFTAPNAMGYGYAVFGKVTDDKSLAVVDKIRKAATRTEGFMENVPVKAITINKIKKL